MGFNRKKTKPVPDIFCEKEVSGREDVPKQSSDMPKKFATILNIQKNPRAKPIEKIKKAEKGPKTFSKELKILPNETLIAFNNRVDMYLGDPVEVKPGRISKKKEKKKKLHEQALKAYTEAKEAEAKSKDFHKMTDKVKFGEVAMAPPTLTAKPKDRAKNKRLLLSGALLPVASGNTKKKQKMSSEGTTKAKKPTRSPAEKRIMEAERDRLVQAYRKLKVDRENRST
ncbi:hypothetical protein DSO57_1002678 [Entomophthora muscae]|uniref:Uncharacterized protein n=1 Tax=Entomophthora muscae TaxID=34485 RepID=A0ACC2UIK3_9FUNG|nr:hypothetical protein DSO57_1002678 [Entomophthora muscae]